MVLGNKLPVPGRPTNLGYSRARAYCACSRCGWGCLDNFSLIYHFSFLSRSLWERVRYRLKYCLKGPLSLKQPTNQLKVPLNPKQPTNQPNLFVSIFPKMALSASSLLNLSSISELGSRVVRRCCENFQCRGVLLIWIIVGQGPIALAVGADGGCLDIFFSSIFSLTARYRLKLCLKGLLNPKQPTISEHFFSTCSVKLVTEFEDGDGVFYHINQCCHLIF